MGQNYLQVKKGENETGAKITLYTVHYRPVIKIGINNFRNIDEYSTKYPLLSICEIQHE